VLVKGMLIHIVKNIGRRFLNLLMLFIKSHGFRDFGLPQLVRPPLLQVLEFLVVFERRINVFASRTLNFMRFVELNSGSGADLERLNPLRLQMHLLLIVGVDIVVINVGSHAERRPRNIMGQVMLIVIGKLRGRDDLGLMFLQGLVSSLRYQVDSGLYWRGLQI
jgi:hypothetical protein